MDSATREMPKYLCHKKVHALKIAKIVHDGENEPDRETDGSAMITPADEGFEDYARDLLAYRKQKESEWEKQKQEELESVLFSCWTYKNKQVRKLV
jgi:hypothetical protein